MNAIEDIVCDALKTARSEVLGARRMLFLSVGVLAIIHLLTVSPYLATSQKLGELTISMKANTELVAQLDPEIEKLRQAEDSARRKLDRLLEDVTKSMIKQFDDLRNTIDIVKRADRSEPMRPSAADSLQTPSLQRPQVPPTHQMPIQGAEQWLQERQLQGRERPSAGRSIVDQPKNIDNELDTILNALADNEPDAYDQLTDYVRLKIVAVAYKGAHQMWSENIRKDYLNALNAAEKGALQAAATPLATVEIAEAFQKAADQMREQRLVIEEIEIRHDDTVAAPIDRDFWRTRQGKVDYAKAIRQSIKDKLHAVVETTDALSGIIHQALDLQQKFRDQLIEQQRGIEQQFEIQRKQLTTLSGAAGVFPVDLASFIGLFPLVIGLVTGLLLLRVGEARRQAEFATSEIGELGNESIEVHRWLTRRVLGGHTVTGPTLVTLGLAFAAVFWIVLTAMQVSGSLQQPPPLSAQTSGFLASLFVLAAAIWDAVAIRRIAKGLRF